MAPSKINENKICLNVLNTEDLTAPFAPWKREDRGQQVYIKLTKEGESVLLFVGENCVLDASMQQTLMRLTNDGWTIAGELTLSFDGFQEPGIDPYVYQDPITLELGCGLLPLVDPQYNAPLTLAMPKLRDEIAKESGLVPAGVHIKDNLNLERSQYLIYLHNSPVASGEIFLDRFLAIGSFEQLSDLEGWATVEPTYRVKAKWIEEKNREKAESMGCMLAGPLQVLLTHIKSVMLQAAPELLGLQDTFNLISRLQVTHPVVVEDFLNNRKNLRCLRKILQNLLREEVALNNLVTILETIGDNLENIDNIDKITEECRLSLARQICSKKLNANGELLAIITGTKLEKALRELQELSDPEKDPEGKFEELADKVVNQLRQALHDANNPPAIITIDKLRRFLTKLIHQAIPGVSVLSNNEVALSRVKLIVNGTAELKDEKKAETPPAEETSNKESKESKKSEGLLGLFKK
ncbi:FHIPEP family type III secretion protein [bacterium]|nr:FHIPEP family type III secretion protein [bacterium]